MPTYLHSPRRAGRAGRPLTFPSLLGRVVLPALCAFACAPALRVSAQDKTAPAAVNSSCSRDLALATVRQQIEASRQIDDQVKRINVLLRAANLLWVLQPESARGVFAEAFELAAANFREKGDEPRREGLALFVDTTDQRYVVINAIAKRDNAWAKKLTEQMLEQDRREAEDGATRNPQRDIRTAAKLLGLATTLLASDAETAVVYARVSLRYPGSIQLPIFLYKFAELNQTAADRFYGEALAAYRDSPLSEFLYLSAYPFGNVRAAGDMPVTMNLNVPAVFAPHTSLQRSFLQALLTRAQRALEGRGDEGSFSGISGEGQLWMALTRLEPQVRQGHPDLLEALVQTRDNLFALLTQESQRDVTAGVSHRAETDSVSFDEQLAAASKERNSDSRDQIIVSAILRAPEAEGLEPVLAAADRIADTNVRRQVLNWVYFSRAQGALKEKRFEDARALASKVEELDQRAYLSATIAKELLLKAETREKARELLDEMLVSAGKAPDTVVKVRTLLAGAYLYAQFDSARSLSVLNEAVASVNRIEAPDFSRQSLVRRIEAKNFARYATFQTPEFSPEAVFSELGKNDFDLAVSQANNIADRSLRSNLLLAVAETCLRDAAQKQKRENTKKKTKP